MLVTGWGPQEIEKYCLLPPDCNIFYPSKVLLLSNSKPNSNQKDFKEFSRFQGLIGQKEDFRALLGRKYFSKYKELLDQMNMSRFFGSDKDFKELLDKMKISRPYWVRFQDFKVVWTG